MSHSSACVSLVNIAHLELAGAGRAGHGMPATPRRERAGVLVQATAIASLGSRPPPYRDCDRQYDHHSEHGRDRRLHSGRSAAAALTPPLMLPVLLLLEDEEEDPVGPANVTKNSLEDTP